MRIITVDSITGKERLAKDIINNNDMILMTSGTIIKKEYIHKLKELNVEYIYVEDEIGMGINLTNSLELQLMDHCQDAVREILTKFSYHKDSELEEIKLVAEEIINDILKEPEVIFNLSSIREKSDSTFSHSINVCALSVILAFKLKLPKSKVRDIAIGSLLHDIGFTYMPQDYLNLKVENCSPKEWKEIKKHIIYGYTMVENMSWLSMISKDIILSHHERLDGSGYPFHLKEDRIRIGSRIVAVCDEFDSRVYGNMMRKMKVQDVIDYIVSKAGILFDFNVVKVFVESVAAFPTGSIVITNEGETAIVLKQNPKCPTRPVIRIIKNKKGENEKDWIEKDLTQELTLFIIDTITE